MTTAAEVTKYAQQLDTLERIQRELDRMWTAPDGGEYRAQLVHRGDELSAEYIEVRVWFAEHIVSAPSVRVYGHDETAPVYSEGVEFCVEHRDWDGGLVHRQWERGPHALASRLVAMALDDALGVNL